MNRVMLAVAILALGSFSGCGERERTVFTPPPKADRADDREAPKKSSANVVNTHNIPMH